MLHSSIQVFWSAVPRLSWSAKQTLDVVPWICGNINQSLTNFHNYPRGTYYQTWYQHVFGRGLFLGNAAAQHIGCHCLHCLHPSVDPTKWPSPVRKHCWSLSVAWLEKVIRCNFIPEWPSRRPKRFWKKKSESHDSSRGFYVVLRFWMMRPNRFFKYQEIK